ncbi:hypothetical protein NDAWWUGD_CDS0014 [Salmonella phage SeKF_80]
MLTTRKSLVSLTLSRKATNNIFRGEFSNGRYYFSFLRP